MPPPGPKSRELCLALATTEAPAVNTLGPANEPAIVWQEALGANVLDVDGNRYIDLTSGFGVAALGHRPPSVVAAIARQAGILLHGLGDVASHPSRVELARRLVELAPVDDGRVHFAISGADAVEIALKTAIAAARRSRGDGAPSRIVAFDPGYHGTTLFALAATSRPAFREPFAGHLTPHVERLPFGGDLEPIARALDGAAALIVEPIVGREGVLVPPPGWLAALARLCRENGALFIADEILTGFGRTGARFAVDHEGVRPDLLCCGKALGGGLPIAAVVGRSELMEIWRGSAGNVEALHTATFLAHPLACAAALAALDEIEGSNLAARAFAIGERIEARLVPLAGRGVHLRGRGALRALAFDDASAAPALVEALRARGVLALGGGPEGRVVELLPPLTIDFAQLDVALDIVAAALAGLTR